MIKSIVAAAAAGFIGYSALYERAAVRLTKLEFAFSRLPREFDGFTILQLSDTHISHWWDGERRMEQIVRANPADMLVVTGDIAVNARGARLVRDFLDRVRPDGGIYAVWGNTEHKGEYGRGRRADLTYDDLRVLVNEHVMIERNGAKIVLAGVDDPFTRHDDLDRALEDAPANAFKLLLAHAPSIAGRACDAGVDLMLSGHTHGGQVRVPVIGCVYPHMHEYTKLIMGLFEGKKLSRILGREAGEMRVYVSRGIGISNLPMRFLCPPEIVHVTLLSTDS